MKVTELRAAIDGAVDKGKRMALAEVTQEARVMSSGTETTESLRAKDHPYATRHAAPLLPPEIINSQSDEFRTAWRSDVTPDGGRIVNDAPHADFLQFGTSTMHRRPIADKLEEQLAEASERQVTQQLRRLK